MQIFKKGTAVLTASIMLFSSFVGTNSNLSIKAETSTNEPTTIKGDYDSNGKITALDLSAMIQFILGKTNFDSTKFSSMDIDNDGNINIIDLILLKSIAMGKEINVASSQIAKYNNIAKQIYENAIILYKNLKDSGYYSNNQELFHKNDPDYFIELLNSTLNIHEDSNYSVKVNRHGELSVLYGDNITGYCGAYPNMISQKMNIPYPDSPSYNNLEMYLDYALFYINWEERCSEFISKDPTQASLPYYPNITVSEANNIAKQIFTTAQDIFYEYEEAGKELPFGDIGEFADYFNSDFHAEIAHKSHLKQGAKFAILRDGYTVKSVLYSDPTPNCSGAYPNMISQKLSIPYPNVSSYDSLFKHLHYSLFDFNWEEHFSEFISKDPTQASLPYYPNITVSEANNIAKKIFATAQAILQDYETAGKELPYNDIYEFRDDDRSEFAIELRENINLKIGAKFAILLDGYTVKSVFYSDPTPNCSGAYPNVISQKLSIPYPSPTSSSYNSLYDYLRYASYPLYNWEEFFPEFISKDPTQASLPYYPSKNITVSETNNIAKQIFVTAQAILQDYETAGKPFSYNFYEFREYDSNQFSYDLREGINLKIGARFAISFDGYNVKSVFYSDPTSNCSGAYPNAISQKMDISYPDNSSNKNSISNYLQLAFFPLANWEDAFPEFISKDPFKASLPYYPALSVSEANDIAKTILTTAQSILQDYETAGKPLPFENNIYEYELDDNNEFFLELNQNVNLKPNSTFSILFDGYTVKGVFYDDTTPYCFGAFPNKIPTDISLNIAENNSYINYLTYASDENFDWSQLIN
jgi:hypothetical protein